MIKLVNPSAEYAEDIMKLRQEFLDENPEEDIHGAGNLRECSNAEEWIRYVENMRKRETCPENLVDSDIYLAVRTESGRIVGITELRHHIDHPVLSTWGGHIGYCVRPTERRKGYAHIILSLVLDACRGYGIHEVLLTCSEDNLASERTICGGGGIYEKTVWAEPLKMNMKRFWINVGENSKSVRNIIFLDIDGVLNSNFWNETHQREISDGTLIDEKKIKLLAQLVGSTNAEIILHSGWRFWYGENGKPLREEAQRLSDLLEKEGLKITGVTPDLTTEEIRRTKKFSLVKAKEILLWVESHADIGGWVVLDDLDLHSAVISEHQVKTDQAVGLTPEDVQKAEKILLL